MSQPNFNDPNELKELISPCLKKATWSGFQCKCCSPLREDRNPSFSINVNAPPLGTWQDFGTGDSGTVKDLLERLGVCSFNSYSPPPPAPAPIPIQEVDEIYIDTDNTYAILDVPKDEEEKKVKVKSYEYRDEKGTLLYKVFRKDTPNEKKRIWQSRYDYEQNKYVKSLYENGKLAVKLVPYKLPDILNAYEKGINYLFVVEGEKCADILWDNEIPATTNNGGGGKWKDEFNTCIPEQMHIIIIPDADKPGIKHAEQVKESFLNSGHNVKLLDLGYPIIEKHGKDIYDWLTADEHNIEELKQLSKKTKFETINEDSIRFAEPEEIEFPAQAMPEALKRLIEVASKSQGYPKSFIAVPILTVLGAAIGGYTKVEINPGHQQKPNLFTAVIGESGSGKSPAQAIAVSPIIHLQETLKEEVDNHNRKIKAEIKELKRLKKNKLNKKDSRIDDDLREAQKDLRKYSVLYVNNATTEALLSIHQENPKGVIQIFDELSALVTGMNQYKGGKGDDRQFWLTAWSGREFIKVRKGKNAYEGMEIHGLKETCISVTGGIQPAEITKIIGKNREASSDGFAQRFLMAYPGQYPRFYQDNEGVPQYLIDAYKQLFTNVYQYGEEGKIKTKILKLTREAKQIWINGFNYLQKEIMDGKVSKVESEAWKKLPSQAARIALIIHVVRLVSEQYVDEDIDQKSMAMAWELINYFKACFRKVYKKAGAVYNDDKTQRVLSYIKKKGKVTARKVQMAKIVSSAQDAKIILEKMTEQKILDKKKQGKTETFELSETYYNTGKIPDNIIPFVKTA